MDSSVTFRILSSVDPDAMVVAVAGELDIFTAPRLRVVLQRVVAECGTPARGV